MKLGGSDLHLKVGLPVMIRHKGEIRQMDMPPLTESEMERLCIAILDEREKEIFAKDGGVDFAHVVGEGEARFRVNLFKQRGAFGMVWLGEQDINLGQLAEGYAWHYQYYARKTQGRDDFQRYAVAEQQAREQRLGLWQDENPTPPWNFRRARKSAAVLRDERASAGAEPPQQAADGGR